MRPDPQRPGESAADFHHRIVSTYRWRSLLASFGVIAVVALYILPVIIFPDLNQLELLSILVGMIGSVFLLLRVVKCCPNCGRYTNRSDIPATCPHCGIRLRD